MKKINLILYFILGLYSCSEIEDLPDNTTVNAVSYTHLPSFHHS